MLTPLSHWLICVEVGVLTEDTAARVSRFAIMICEVKSTDVSPPTADAGLEGVAPPFIRVWGVSLPGALRAPYDPFSASLIPAAMALLWELAVFFHKVVAATGVTGAELVEISASRGRVGRGGLVDLSMLLVGPMRACSGMGGKGAAGGWVIVGS
jgi:hypothetical protein